MTWLARFSRSEQGGIAVMSAAGVGAGCILAAVVIDATALALHVRQLQGAADLAALAAAADLPRAPSAALATAHANIRNPDRVVTVTGRYIADRSLTPSNRFQGVADPSSHNAARVTVTHPAPLFFAPIFLGQDAITVSRTATAAIRAEEPMAMLSIGSRLARLDGGLANQVLSGLTGSTIALSVMDYRALADAQVNLLTYTDALALHADVTAGDYETLLDSRIDAGDALRIVEEVSIGADQELNQLASSVDGKMVRIGDLIGLDTAAPEGLRGGLNAAVSALDLSSALIEVASGDRQIRLDLGARPGLADVDVWLAVGERPNASPWMTVARDGSRIVRTAQARLYLEARTAQSLAGLAQVNLPVLVELAAAEARLDAIRCEPEPSVTVGVRPGLARIGVGAIDRGRLDDFTAPLPIQNATLVQLAGVAKVTGKSETDAASPGFVQTRFDADDIRNRRPATVGSHGLASGALSSTLDRLSLRVDVLGLGLGLGDLASATRGLLRPIGPVLDDLVEGLLVPLGLSLGEADVTVPGVSCPRAAPAPALVS